MHPNDNLIYDSKDSTFIRTENAIRATAGHRTFLIICQYGDWSGFRTLAECQKQFPELERTMVTNHAKDGFYQVVER